MSDAGYYGRVNPELLKLIPPDAKTVLEIGCGEGALCEAYRRVNPGVKWYGVEKHETASRSAKDKGICILGSDAELQTWSVANPEELCDCLILGDILEHLRDPWSVLKNFAGHIKPGAQVLASIPNVGHWTVIRDLLDGKWDYTDEGLLDRTHLRFFTLKSIREMFDKAGLQIFECRGRRIFNEGYNEFLREENELPHRENMLVYQWIARAIKPVNEMTIEDCEAGQPIRRHQLAIRGTFGPKPIPKLHIHAVTAEACCALPRILEPFAMLETIPGVKCTTGAVPERAPTGDKILIIQRNWLIDTNHRKQFIDNGWLIVQECDDYPLAYQNGEQNDWMSFRGCHAISCSTEAIAEIVRQYNPNVMVFENQIAELEPFHEQSKDPIEINLFFGAQNRQEDWKPVMSQLNRILNNTPTVTMNVIHDREFFDAIESDRKQFFEFAPYAEYRGILSMCDIALLPLEDTPFNRCKSDIKFLECAAEGVVSLAQTTVYEHLIQHDPDMVFACGFYQWEDDFSEILELLISDSGIRSNMAERAYAYVRDNRLLSQHYRKRYDWYQSLVSNKQRLTQELLERVPALQAEFHAVSS